MTRVPLSLTYTVGCGRMVLHCKLGQRSKHTYKHTLRLESKHVTVKFRADRTVQQYILMYKQSPKRGYTGGTTAKCSTPGAFGGI